MFQSSSGLFTAVLFAFMSAIAGFAMTSNTYQVPPKAIADLVNAPRTPFPSLSPDDKTLLLSFRREAPGIEELAEPEVRLAGLRINPANNGPSRPWAVFNQFVLVDVASGKESPITGLPEGRWISPSWSPDGKHLAMIHMAGDGLEIWVASTADAKARRLTGKIINGAIGWGMFQWLNNNELICRTIPRNRGEEPAADVTPTGPSIQETKGEKAAVRTYQDLLRSPRDEDRFAHFLTTQITRIDLTGKQTPIGDPLLLWRLSVAPDGNHLLVTAVQRPFSYIVPYSRFPHTVEVWDTNGKRVNQFARIPLAENIPKGFDATREGPRSIQWRDDQPATLVWVEAQDGGDPARETEVRDHVYQKAAPFDGKPQLIVGLGLRYSGIDFSEQGTALAYSRWWRTRKERTWVVSPGSQEPTLLFDRSSEDRYTDPGNPIYRPDAKGRYRIALTPDGKSMFMRGRGASPEGNRPFLDKVNLATGESERLWRSQAPHFESVVAMLDNQGTRFITQRESIDTPANFTVRTLGDDQPRALTDFPHPFPQLKGITKELITYKRADGVDLSGTLYLPPGYDPKRDGRLPVLMWAYPREFKNAAAAGQVTDSPHRFLYVSYWGPMPFLTQGYAVLDNPSLPIIGEGEAQPNDTYVEQLVSGAKAAIDEIVRRGVADPERIAIGGHSYGAFMVANLLAHSDLFSSGIARSGAYNRTLTPFGFQAEERNFWEAKDVYGSMSSFFHADKIDEPILIIHGDADNNSGTYPLQSRRLFSAVKGLGGTARLVMLPHESHGYRARESLLHMLWESHQWLEKYTKGTTPSRGGQESSGSYNR